MVVREVIKALKSAKEIAICYADNAVKFNRKDSLMADAYADYVVDEIRSDGEGYFEIELAMVFVKAAS